MPAAPPPELPPFPPEPAAPSAVEPPAPASVVPSVAPSFIATASPVASAAPSVEPVAPPAPASLASVIVSVAPSVRASVAPSTDPSVAPSTPPSAPGAGPHVPIAAPVVEHTCDGGQPLPPASWQPGTQREVVLSQTRPELAPPQSASAVQPHEPPVTQRAPPRSMRHALWSVGVHSTQVCVSVAHTKPPVQSRSARHCTQTLLPSVVSQRPVGVVQSPSPAHAVVFWQ